MKVRFHKGLKVILVREFKRTRRSNLPVGTKGVVVATRPTIDSEILVRFKYRGIQSLPRSYLRPKKVD